MVKLAVLTMLAVGSIHSVARADTSAKACDQDPRCYARELALTLTGPSEYVGRSIELPRVAEFDSERVRSDAKTHDKAQAAEPRHSSSMKPSSFSE